uniref:Uncharacterized protein n=1 Tax=Cacopsylla melanoneura TaxID=428564 RepID=A0A8D9AJS1_9HEMI
MLDFVTSRKYSDQLFQVEVYRRSDESNSERKKKLQQAKKKFSRPHSYHGNIGKSSSSMTQQIANKLMACTATSATYQRPSSCTGGFEYKSDTWRFQPVHRIKRHEKPPMAYRSLRIPKSHFMMVL